MNDTVYLLALRNINGIGDIFARRLIKRFGSAEEVFKQSLKSLTSVEGINNKIAESILNLSSWDEIEKETERINKMGIGVISCFEAGYPENLRNIYNYPLFLYYSGNYTDEDINALAVVGSRDCDDYGLRVTEKIVAGLTELGITIISGMARGIDTAAHLTALRSGGRTAAVLGNGIDICYPPENKKLYNRIRKLGFILSEYPAGTEPDSKNFPKRNRLISGLSKGVVVIQANKKSGALITADYACEQNRDVFAVPGNINNMRNSGTNQLIKSGAKLVENVNDIVDEISSFRSLSSNNRSCNMEIDDLTDEESRLYKQLVECEQHIDQLTSLTGMEISKLSEMLLNLELRGIISSMPGNYYKILKQ